MGQARFLWRFKYFVNMVNKSSFDFHGLRVPNQKCQLEASCAKAHRGFDTNSSLPPILALFAAVTWPFGKSTDAEEVEATTKKLFTDALRHIWASDFTRADRTLNQLLRHLSAANNRHLISNEQYVHQRTRVSAELANVNLAMKKLPEAEKLIKEVIRNAATAHIPLTDPMIVEMSLKLAMIYQKMSRTEEARSGFEYCITTQETKLASGDIVDPDELSNEQALLGMCHNYYSKFLFEIGNNKEALEHAEKALKLASKLYAENHYNCLHLLCDVAVILTGLNKFSEARACLDQAEKLTRARLEKETESGDGLRSCLAHILLQRLAVEAQDGHIPEAINYAKEVRKIASSLEAPRSILDQLRDYRKRYKLDAR